MSIFNYSDNIMVGNEQVSAVIIDGVSVWVNKPSEITDFNASDNEYQAITCTWSAATSSRPITYNLINNNSGAVIATNVTSGYVYNVGTGTYNLRVDAVNDGGTTPSNVNSGTSLARPTGSKEFTSSSSWKVPDGVISVTLCMIGGGGGGANWYTKNIYGGGVAGEVISRTVNVTPGETIEIVVGSGGAGGGTNSTRGNHGSQSKFGSVIAGGGNGGGTTSRVYAGNGQARTTCYGTYYNGIWMGDSRGYGGQAGFGNGGRGGSSGLTAGDGVRGAGGGVGDTRAGGPGSGGNGLVKISW